MKKSILILLTIVLFIPLSQAFGHGLGSVESEISYINGNPLKILVETKPDVLEHDTSEIDFFITTINDDTGQKLSDIVYHVELLSGQENTKLIEFNVASPENKLIMKVIPSQSPLTLSGEKSGDNWIGSASNVLEISGDLFSEGGLYQVNVSILSISGTSVSGSDTFVTLLTIGEYVPFEINYKNTKYDFLFATYFDKIREFSFDERGRIITADMPFNWDKEFVSKIPFVHAEYYIPKTLDIYKNHEIIMTINGIELLGTIDRSGDDEIVVHFLIPTNKLVKYSDQMKPEDFNQIIFGITSGDAREEEKADASLEAGEKQIKLSTQEDWKLHFQLTPKGGISPNSDITFNVEFHDPVTNAIIPQITYNMDVFLNGELVESDSFYTSSGRDARNFSFDREGAVIVRISNINDYDTGGEFAFQVKESTIVQGDPAITVQIAQNSAVPGCEADNSCYVPYNAEISLGDIVKWNNGDSAAHTITSGTPSGGPDGIFDSEIIAAGDSYMNIFEKAGSFDYYCSLHPWMIGIVSVQNESAISIPDWVRNNAAWWSEGQISDNDFASGIEFMIKEKIILVPVTSSSSQSDDATIPDWVRNNAAWWSEGQISDKDFANGIQYLVTNGIIFV